MLREGGRERGRRAFLVQKIISKTFYRINVTIIFLPLAKSIFTLKNGLNSIGYDRQ
jgi:hypothetical protein